MTANPVTTKMIRSAQRSPSGTTAQQSRLWHRGSVLTITAGYDAATGRFHMSCRRGGAQVTEHCLDAAVTDDERLMGHWRGFVASCIERHG